MFLSCIEDNSYDLLRGTPAAKISATLNYSGPTREKEICFDLFIWNVIPQQMLFICKEYMLYIIVPEGLGAPQAQP
jgi:hypothetical protein